MTDSTSSDLAGVPVLIVEDDDVSAKVIAVALEGEGCETRRAASAEEALWILARFAPRAIVLDLVLPQMSGLVFAQQLKRDAATRDIVIIATSAFNEAEAGPLADRVGCADYVRKPIDPTSLRRVLLDHLERRRLAMTAPSPMATAPEPWRPHLEERATEGSQDGGSPEAPRVSNLACASQGRTS